jgi:predicted enzyme related to lactoylglutathione lyase
MAGDGELRIDRIGQIRIYVHDIHRAVAIYRDVLGMRFLFDVEQQGLAFFDCGGVRLFMAAADPESLFETSVIYYDVDSVDATFETLKQRGVEVIHEPQTIYTTDTAEGRMAFLKDSEGNTFALMAETPLSVA